LLFNYYFIFLPYQISGNQFKKPMTIKASKVNHRGSDRIKVDIPYNPETIRIIKQIPDAKWSKTMKAWHLPYTQTAYELLKKILPETEFPKIEQPASVIIEKKPEEKISTTPKDVSIEVSGRRIFLRMPKNDMDVQFLRLLRFSYWDKNAYLWIIPNYNKNLELLKEHFKDRLQSVNILQQFENQINSTEKRILEKDTLLIIKTKAGRLRVIFCYNPTLTQAIKNIPYSNWDANNKWWSVPFSDKILDKIKALAQTHDMSVIYEEEANPACNRKARIGFFDIPNYRPCPEIYVLKLKELRYGDHTIETYRSLFEEFINYYYRYDIDRIDESMIVAFMRYLVIERKVSTSYQNQSINIVYSLYSMLLCG